MKMPTKTTTMAAHCVLAASLLMLSACSNGSTHYAYIKVAVSLDPMTIDEDVRHQITACGFSVTGADSYSASLPGDKCQLDNTPYELGSFEYETTTKTGQLVFTVNANALRRNVATGMSAPVTIVPDMTVSTRVVLMAIPQDGGMPGDGGAADGGGAADAKTDAGGGS